MQSVCNLVDELWKALNDFRKGPIFVEIDMLTLERFIKLSVLALSYGLPAPENPRGLR